MLLKTIRNNPTEEPVTLAEIKAQLRIETDFTTDDDLLELLGKAARERVESYCNRYFAECDITLVYSEFPLDNAPFKIGIPLIQSVTSITYILDGTEETLDSGDYELDSVRSQIRTTDSWPTGIDVAITLVCGETPVTGTPVAVIPFAVKQAILLYVTDFYQVRGNLEPMQMYDNKACDALLYPYRVNLGV